MLFVRLTNGQKNNDWTYMHELFEREPHVYYNTYDMKHPVIFYYYPKFDILMMSKYQVGIVYMFRNQEHVNEIYEYVKNVIVHNNIKKKIKELSIIEQMDPLQDDTKYVTVNQRLFNAKHNINEIENSWKSPFSSLELTDVNEQFCIDTTFHIKQIEQMFNIKLIKS